MQLTRRGFGKGLAFAAAAGVTGVPVIEGCSTSWISTLEADLPELVNIASSIISVVSLATGNASLPAEDGQLITMATQALQASLQTLSDAVSAYNANKGNGTLAAITAAIAATQADAQKVIAALPAGVVSTTTQTAIVSGIGLLITILSSVELLIPGAAPASVTAKAMASATVTKPTVPNAAAIRTGYNSTLIVLGFAGQQIK